MATTSEGSRCPDISYNGTELSYGGPLYYWRIKFWDEENNEGEWNTDVATFRMVPTSDYGAKIESGDYVKYQFVDGEYWLATEKKGTQYKFGYATTSRQNDPSDEDKVYKWMLEEIRDTNDNYITYEYFKHNGQIYPATTTYTGYDSTDGIFEVEFLRESRSDSLASYHAGFKVETDYRIYEIQAKINGAWVRKYELDYATGDNGVHSVLSTITVSGRDKEGNTTVLPATTFDYQEKGDDWEEDESYSIPEYFSRQSRGGARLADVNGDGLVDILMYDYVDEDKVYINDGDGWALSGYSIPVQFEAGNLDEGVRLADVNGDGLVDMLHSAYHSSSWQDQDVYINNGEGGWTLDSNYVIPEGVYFTCLSYTCDWADPGARLADVNGDGLADILSYKESGNNYVYINKGDGTGWSLSGTYSMPQPFVTSSGYDYGTRMADVNGDGLDDVLFGNDSYDRVVYINNGSAWAEDSNYNIPMNFKTDTNGMITACVSLILTAMDWPIWHTTV